MISPPLHLLLDSLIANEPIKADDVKHQLRNREPDIDLAAYLHSFPKNKDKLDRRGSWSVEEAMVISGRRLTEDEQRALKARLTRVLDRGTRTSDARHQVRTALSEILQQFDSEVVVACLREIQHESEGQIMMLEHRLGMLVEAHAEISRHNDYTDPIDLMNLFFKRRPPE